ncbi:MAG: asparagine--tRNA ligase [Euryarchaeota archaeon RBG_16_68_12]|nr:MAG: asparagine--tRNA ligase [Euryarchaeota archaeon RBG_16_68_12]
MPSIADVLAGKLTGREVELRGWIYRTRTVGGKVFVVMRDATGVLQVTITKGEVRPEAFEAAAKALIESSVQAKGTIVQDKRAPGGVEVRAKDFTVVQFAEKYPITEDQSEEFLLDVRHLWVRSQRMTQIFRVRHSVLGAVHAYFRDKGFWQVDPPMITPAGSEGGSTLFEMDYFGRKAYLTQSWQLYAEALVLAMEKVYYVGPSFRAEKSRTTRHLTEYWHAEMEEAWAGMDEAIAHAEGVISAACRRVAEERPAEVTALGRTPEFLRAVTPPFERIRYDEALKVLKAKGMELEWGRDLRTFEERALTEGKAKPVVVTHYPKVSQAFYKRRDPADPRCVLAFDVIAGDDVGEIVGGSERETDLDVLTKSLVEQGEDPRAYDWYLDTRRYGSVPHAGFGMGVERLIQWICKLEHIRDAIPFPRTPARFSP